MTLFATLFLSRAGGAHILWNTGRLYGHNIFLILRLYRFTMLSHIYHWIAEPSGILDERRFRTNVMKRA